MKSKTNKTTTTKATTPLRDQCLGHFATLGIPLEPPALDELLSRAEKEGLPHLQFLDLLLGAQANARRERGVARRIREAHFAEDKTVDFEGNKISNIGLSAHPESFQLERNGSRIFVNLPGSMKVAVVDRNKSAVIASWGTGLCLANFPMALDEANHRLPSMRFRF